RDPARQDHHPRRARPLDPRGRGAGDGRRAHPPSPAPCRGGTDHRRPRLRAQVPPARSRLRQDEGPGGRRGDRARGTGVSFRTTHTGSLPRPEYLLEPMFAREAGEAALGEAIERATAEVVARQIEAGISAIGDGEMSKPSYATYIK